MAGTSPYRAEHVEALALLSRPAPADCRLDADLDAADLDRRIREDTAGDLGLVFLQELLE